MSALRPRRIIRRVRRTLYAPRHWPFHRKLAVGVWVPVVIVAIAMFTGPNRPAGGSPNGKVASPGTATAQITTPTTELVARSELGAWVRKGHKHKRRFSSQTSAGDVAILQAKAALRVERQAAAAKANKALKIASKSQPLTKG